jgi:hypothetical protein
MSTPTQWITERMRLDISMFFSKTSIGMKSIAALKERAEPKLLGCGKGIATLKRVKSNVRAGPSAYIRRLFF